MRGSHELQGGKVQRIERVRDVELDGIVFMQSSDLILNFDQ